MSYEEQPVPNLFREGKNFTNIKANYAQRLSKSAKFSPFGRNDINFFLNCAPHLPVIFRIPLFIQIIPVIFRGMAKDFISRVKLNFAFVNMHP